ncbi:MAG: ABC transporter permease [Acidobacteriota bacterium]
MDRLWQDIRFALRMLIKHRGFTAVAVMTLALGIGANTAIFSVVNAVLLRQLPFKQPEQLLWIWSVRTDRDKAFFSIPDFADYRDRNQTLEQISAMAYWGANLTGAGDPERLQGVRMSAHAFEMLGAEAALGRALIPEDDRPNSQRVVVLTHGLWQRRFGADASLIGKTLALNGDSYTVVGVLPSDFVFPWLDSEMVVPIKLDLDPRRADRDTNFLRAFARLKPGVTREQAQADLASIAGQLQQEYPEANAKKIAPRALTLREEIVGDYRKALLLLLCAVGLVLLIACSNIANLLLARASARHKEMAIRRALGASGGHLVKQLLTESVILASIGGALGLMLAAWGVDLLLALSPANLPRAHEAGIDGRVLGFTIGLSLAIGLLFGLAPALEASRADLNEELKAGSRGTGSSPRRNRVRSLLVVSEVALAVVLLTGAGLFIKSFARLQRVSAGFDTENLLLARLSLSQAKYSNLDSVMTFYEQVSERIKNLPGVESVGAANVLPLSGLFVRTDFTISGRAAMTSSEAPSAQNRWVSPGYFGTMRIPLLQGRDFTEQDKSGGQGVTVIDETLARRHFPNQNPIGTHLKFFERDFEIVGVVGAVKHNGLDDEPSPTLYGPLDQVPKSNLAFLTSNMSLAIRTGVQPLALQTGVRNEVQAVDGEVPASSMKTMEQFLSTSVAPRRFNLLLLLVFAAAALLLAVTGIYAVISYSVTQRTHEIGVRLALGAAPRDVLRLIVGKGMALALAGVGVGLIVSVAITRVMKSLLFDVSATDPATFAAVSVILAGVALGACFVPARRASRVDPMIALRNE